MAPPAELFAQWRHGVRRPDARLRRSSAVPPQAELFAAIFDARLR